MWADRHVVLGVSGGIACYKSCILARRLTEAGARVDVVLTQGAAEFVRRHEQQLHASLHQQVEISHGDARVTVALDIEPDEDHPSALLRATDASGELLAEVRVAPSFKLTRASATAWAEAGFSAAAVRRG